jgi:hypothetical protein
MWSGPRNISTAMMRAWENRNDTVVCDEPLYAHYLLVTGKDHPGRHETLAKHERDWKAVAAWLVGPLPEGTRVFYQKHMAHHLLPNIDRTWLADLRHCFLIRDPLEMLTSLRKHLPAVTLEDTGLPQQVELFDRVMSSQGQLPPVLDARDVLQQPELMLRKLCSVLDLDFQPSMLQWPKGPRLTDGAWAPYWYRDVYQTTGFAPYRKRECHLPEDCQSLLNECQTYYKYLYSHRLCA